MADTVAQKNHAALSRPKGWVLILLLLPGAGLVTVFMVLVLSRVVIMSLGYNDFGATVSRFSLTYWQQQWHEPRFWRAFFWSADMAAWSAFLAVALAYPFALWLRRPFPGSLYLSALLKAPYLVPGLVAAFLLINVISFHGFVNEFMVWTGLWSRPLRMQNDSHGYAIIGLQVWKQLPLAYLLLAGSVQAIPDPVLLAARDMGAGRMARFFKVVLPLSVQAMQAALALVFIGAAGDYSFQSVAGPPSVNSLATYMDSIRMNNGDWNGAAVVAVMLMVLSLGGVVVLTLIVRLAGRLSRRLA
ncbi:ABC transporter permease [Allorhizobium sp. BGMRC 0089]|uniref:ABC transporter permease n=1 Tax=Allorhizobium sonneratiae TaxID=2934936 RepID=UPI002033B3FB|nr:ABC transporter permease [Allorhizobium sonneratiae]MCM2293912.1 ABC transporter permease [Allorhizobium sonneratiae]